MPYPEATGAEWRCRPLGAAEGQTGERQYPLLRVGFQWRRAAGQAGEGLRAVARGRLAALFGGLFGGLLGAGVAVGMAAGMAVDAVPQLGAELVLAGRLGLLHGFAALGLAALAAVGLKRGRGCRRGLAGRTPLGRGRHGCLGAEEGQQEQGSGRGFHGRSNVKMRMA
ncbi:MAG: hypothetical protein DI538_27975 [Azospira oryzae]|nr:MAG: hypothetical protein DI538_27975 [Azospira oryzae]